MKIDIENINVFENINNVYTSQWRKIYAVMEEDHFKESDIFPVTFQKNERITQINILV